MIDHEDYQAFTWVRENMAEKQGLVLLDPWKATAFVAIAERPVYARIEVAPTGREMEAYRFIENGCVDTAFLRENDIVVVYTLQECRNTQLNEVRKDVYLRD